jgi:branched-chain amino acid transport system substrate-binding protein
MRGLTRISRIPRSGSAIVASVAVCSLLAACGSSSSSGGSSSSGSSGGSASGSATSASSSTTSSGSGSSASSGGDFTILDDSGTTGVDASLGSEWNAGLAAGAAYWNSKGGILGHKIKVVYLNNNSDPSTGVSVLQQYLSTHPKPNVVMGGQESAIVAAVFPALAKQNLIGFSSSAGGSEAQAETDASKALPEQYVLGNSTKLSGEALGHWATQGKSGQKIGILQETAPFFEGETQGVETEVKKAGDTDVVVEADPTALSLTSEAAQLKSDGVSAVAIEAAGATAGYAMKGLASVGLNVPEFSDVGLSSGPVTTLVPAADYKNLQLTTYPDETSAGATQEGTEAQVAAAVATMTAWLNKTGNTAYTKQPYSNTGVGWDMISVLENAAKQANSISQTPLLSALNNLKSQTGEYVSDAKYKYTANNHENADATLGDFGLTKAGPISNGKFVVSK